MHGLPAVPPFSTENPWRSYALVVPVCAGYRWGSLNEDVLDWSMASSNSMRRPRLPENSYDTMAGSVVSVAVAVHVPPAGSVRRLPRPSVRPPAGTVYDTTGVAAEEESASWCMWRTFEPDSACVGPGVPPAPETAVTRLGVACASLSVTVHSAAANVSVVASSSWTRVMPFATVRASKAGSYPAVGALPA